MANRQMNRDTLTDAKVPGFYAARLAIFAIVARLHPVASCICDHDIPRDSMSAIPALRFTSSGCCRLREPSSSYVWLVVYVSCGRLTASTHRLACATNGPAE